MQITHKIELKPNNKQRTYFKKACGISRFVWNWALFEWNKQYEENQSLPEEEQISISGMSLKKKFNSIKNQSFPWVREVTKYAAQQPFIHLNNAYKNYFKKQMKRPRYKKKGKSADSFYIGGDQVKTNGKKIWIPKLGYVRLKERLRFEGKINSATISRTADRWYVAIQVQIEEQINNKCETTDSVGIDFGINRMATLSDGTAIEAPKPLKKYLRKLARHQRVLSKKYHSAKKDGRRLSDSKNFQKQKCRVSKIHAKVSNIRRDSLHKFTSYVTKRYQHISIEDLNVKGMVKNHNLARAIHDIGFSEMRRQLEYKALIRKNTVYVADRFYPSTKKCHVCANKIESLTLGTRKWTCNVCETTHDRDINASINLESLIPIHIRPARPESTPAEITAMQKSVFPILVTSIVETGSKHYSYEKSKFR